MVFPLVILFVRGKFHSKGRDVQFSREKSVLPPKSVFQLWTVPNCVFSPLSVLKCYEIEQR